MYARKILQDLREWSVRPDRKPLVLRGARQVGKTTAVNLFSREYECYLSYNLDIGNDKALFDDKNLSFEDFVKALYFYKDMPVTSAKTLIFIDEIQNSPHAVERMRYFYEKAPHLHVISAGSLLESLIDRHISFPVGRVEYLYMRPLTFDEFLLAIKENGSYDALMQNPAPSYAHEKLLKLFHDYSLIGGMPEIVARYAEHGDIVKLSRIYDLLLTAYSDDVEKYASSPSKASLIRHAISAVPQEAGRRIRFQNFGNSNYRSREMGEALRTLEKAMLIDILYPVTQTRLPLSPDGRKSPKLLFLDTGLLNYRAGFQKELFTATDIQSVYQGRIAEHIVGQELISRARYSIDHPSFWVREKKQSKAEVDYIILNNNRIIPIEVKSGAEGRLRSLHQFMDDAPHATAVRIYSGPYKIDRLNTAAGKPFTLINLPFYCTCVIDRYCDLLS
jgi:uncharacterized protein